MVFEPLYEFGEWCDAVVIVDHDWVFGGYVFMFLFVIVIVCGVVKVFFGRCFVWFYCCVN